jgi:hypothetical protein
MVLTFPDLAIVWGLGTYYFPMGLLPWKLVYAQLGYTS